MNLLQNISIKNKLIVIMLSVTMLSIIAGFTVIIVQEKLALKRKIINESLMHAKLVSEYCITPLDFGYQDEAEANLSKLEAIPAIYNGYVYDINGDLFSSYSRDERIEAPTFPAADNFSYFEGEWLHIFRMINFKDEIKGAIYLRVSTANLSNDLSKLLMSMLLIGIGMMTLAYVLAVWLQRFISSPILDLADFTRQISLNANYSLRITRQGRDEISILYNDVNNMLKQIGIKEKERDKAEEKLKIALERAKESDRLKSTFLATMSHELRTPLNSIIGFSDIIINEDLPIEKILEFNHIIYRSGNHLLNIVTDLFDITLIEAGEVNIIKQNTDIQSIIDQVQEIVTFEINKTKKNNISINYTNKNKSNNVYLYTDAAKISQILINLLKNALKFTESGSINYGYRIETKNDQTMIIFSVEDSGIGIAKEKQEFVFDLFRKVENSHTKSYGGTGIGLSISKKLTNLLGGEIWVESELEKGSTFYFTIPVEEPIKEDKLYDMKEKNIGMTIHYQKHF